MLDAVCDGVLKRGDLFVTFDLASALIDSRTGGRDTAEWLTFAEHSRRALSSTYRHYGLDGAVEADKADLLPSMSGWPL